MIDIPRPEYPRPQLVRNEWMNLNGSWQFETDPGKSGWQRGLHEQRQLSSMINLPFCPESRLSGIGNTDFMECVWYKRDFTLPGNWQHDGQHTLLHIGACDYHTEVWINGISVGTHNGGYTSFNFDITNNIHAGENRITICATDDLRSDNQPAGKQCKEYASCGCAYTRTSGIWQTVWLESVPSSYILRTKYTPILETSSLLVEVICHKSHGMMLCAEASYEGKAVGHVQTHVSGKSAIFSLELDELHLWRAGDPKLYDLTLRLGNDVVQSYFGMRDVAYHNGKILINGKPIFQRLILDQGFYPEGIYTAPSDDELIADIRRSLDMGFNGARLHQKIFEPRFLYHCDKMGYLVWGEHANWGLDLAKPEAWQGFLPEWLEALERDYNHPSIVGWCPLNETQKDQNAALVKMTCDMIRAFDSTRPIVDASGWYHVDGAGEIYDEHDYEQDPVVFKKKYDALLNDESVTCIHINTSGQPVFISEYGGIWWSDVDKDGWGYGSHPKDKQDFVERYKGLTEALLDNPKICAFCYTQLTDVEQEQNGLYTYDRTPKFDASIIAAINRRKAAIEKE